MSNSKKETRAESGRIGTIIGVILCIILLPILIMNVTMIIKGYTNKDQYPTFLGYAPMIVLTDSMYPQIKSGDLIIVKTVEPEKVQPEDVISFFDPDSKENSVLTHRVVRIEQEESLRFITKGDANNAEDTPVPAENLIGVYQSRIEGAGKVAMFLQTTPGLLVSVGVPLLLLLAYEFLRRRRYDREKKEDTDALLAELEALRAKQRDREAQEANQTPDKKTGDAQSPDNP